MMRLSFLPSQKSKWPSVLFPHLQKNLNEHISTVNKEIQKSFRVGRQYLEEAKHAEKKWQKKSNVKQAKRYFIEASQSDLPSDPLLPAKASAFVGICYDLLEDSKNARRWYSQAHNATRATCIPYHYL